MLSWIAKLLKISPKDFKASLKTFKRFSKDFIKPHLFFIVIALVFMMMFSVSTTGRVAMLKPMVNGVFGLKDMSAVYRVSITIAVLSIAMALTQYIYTSLLSVASIKIVNQARVNLYDKFLNQDMKFYHNHPPGSLISVMINDINSLNTLASDVPINLGKDFFLFIALFSYIVFLEPLYAMILLFTIFFVILPLRTINKKVGKYISSGNQYNSELMISLEQSLNNIKEIKSYHTEEYERKKVNLILRNFKKNGIFSAFCFCYSSFCNGNSNWFFNSWYCILRRVCSYCTREGSRVI